MTRFDVTIDIGGGGRGGVEEEKRAGWGERRRREPQSKINRRLGD